MQEVLLSMITKKDLAKALEGVNVDIPVNDKDVSITELLEDSLHLVSLLVQLEVEFNIEFTDDELNDDILLSANHLLEVINGKVADN